MGTITVNWNQWAYELNTSNYVPYNSSNTSVTFENGVGTLTWLKKGMGYSYTSRSTSSYPFRLNHVYYISYMLCPDFQGEFSVEWLHSIIPTQVIFNANQWGRFSFLQKKTNDDNASYIYLPNLRNSSPVAAGNICKFKSIILIDLTQMFGEGNEPQTKDEFEWQCQNNGIDLKKSYPRDLNGTQREWYIPSQHMINGLPVLIDNARYDTKNGTINYYIYDESYFIAGIIDSGSESSKNYTISRTYKDTGVSAIRLYNDINNSSVDYWGLAATSISNLTPRTFDSVGRYLAVGVYKPRANEFFILDNTNQKYLCQGKAESNSTLLTMRNNIISKQPKLQYWFCGNDAPVNGSWIERVQGLEFKLYNGADWDSVNKRYNFDTTSKGAYLVSGSNANNFYMGHHWQFDFDIWINKYISKDTTIFFDIGSVTQANKALGFGVDSLSGNGKIGLNWKLNGNNSSPFSGRDTYHPSYPLSSTDEYVHVIGSYKMVDGGDGYDRLIAKVNGVTVKFNDIQVPQATYGPTWHTSGLAIGTSVYNSNKLITNATYSSYSPCCYIKDIKIYILD